MPFGPQAHCEVDKRAVRKGTRYKREVGQGEEGGKLMKNGEQYDRTHIEHRRTNERRIVGTSAAKAHRLAPTKELPLAALEDSLKFLRLKSYSARANCETIEIMPCEYLRGRWKLRGVEIFRKASNRGGKLCQGL